MNKETSPAEYWAGIAEEVGESIRGYALAQLIGAEGTQRGGIFSHRPEWGLVFLTESSLYIERGSTANWFQSILTARKPTPAPERERILLRDITSVVVPPRATGLRRVFSGPEVVVTIELTSAASSFALVLDRRGANDTRLVALLTESVIDEK